MVGSYKHQCSISKHLTSSLVSVRYTRPNMSLDKVVFILLLLQCFAGSVIGLIRKTKADRPIAAIGRQRVDQAAPSGHSNHRPIAPKKSDEIDFSATYDTEESKLDMKFSPERRSNMEGLEDQKTRFWNDKRLNGTYSCNTMGAKYCIPYKMTGSIGSQKNTAFLKAVRLFHENTPILWVKYNPRKHVHHVSVHGAKDGGCITQIAYRGPETATPKAKKATSQVSSLGPSCWKAVVIFHELMHALGFYHMQSHPDRDKYLSFNKSNVIPADAGEFRIVSRAKWPPSQRFSPHSAMMYTSHEFRTKAAANGEEYAKKHHQVYSRCWVLQRKYLRKVVPNKGFLGWVTLPQEADYDAVNGQYK